jgi:hypothetical protein
MLGWRAGRNQPLVQCFSAAQPYVTGTGSSKSLILNPNQLTSFAVPFTNI